MAQKSKARAGASNKPKAGESRSFTTVRDACAQVLRDAGRPMHYREITDRVIAPGAFNLRRSGGKTPARSVATELAINADGKGTDQFVKTAPGVYAAKGGGGGV